MQKQFFLLLAILCMAAACEKDDIEFPENTIPEILSVTTVNDVVLSGEQIQIRCDAKDADGDSLSFEWKSEFGTVDKQMGRTCLWTAPQVNVQTGLSVSVTVSDDKEPTGKSSMDIIITVLPE